jgi:hypothetical protein
MRNNLLKIHNEHVEEIVTSKQTSPSSIITKNKHVYMSLRGDEAKLSHHRSVVKPFEGYMEFELFYDVCSVTSENFRALCTGTYINCILTV